MTYEICKQYVDESFPIFKRLFDQIWEISKSKNPAKTDRASIGKDIEGLNLVGDSPITLIMDMVIPFVSGVVSMVVAEKILQRTNSSEKQMVKIVKEKAKSVRVDLRMDKKTADDLLPYILKRMCQKQKANRRKQDT